jgi:hypothetical protein
LFSFFVTRQAPVIIHIHPLHHQRITYSTYTTPTPTPTLTLPLLLSSSRPCLSPSLTLLRLHHIRLFPSPSLSSFFIV